MTTEAFYANDQAVTEARIRLVVERARREGTIGVPQHAEPSTLMQFIEAWEDKSEEFRLAPVSG